MRTALTERAQTLGISHAVDFLHDVTEQKELYALVKSAKLFVCLSTREGFGMAVLEAMGCGIPVLTTSAPDNLAQHLVAKYSRGTVCAPTLDAVDTAVQHLLIESDVYPDKKRDTDSWIVDYDWNAMTERAANVYLSHIVRWRRREVTPNLSTQNARPIGEYPESTDFTHAIHRNQSV